MTDKVHRSRESRVANRASRREERTKKRSHGIDSEPPKQKLYREGTHFVPECAAHVVEIPGNGSCMFTALNVGLRGLAGRPDSAQEALNADGILIHMLLGKLKAGDIPAEVRDASIRKMVEVYFPPNSVMITGYGFDMLYAGPREAVLHAVFRQNCGCSHLIVGRDHAGVGDYYGAFDAQTIFQEKVPAGALEIKIFEADHTAYSKKLDRVVMMRDVPDHTKEDFVLLSGTKVREMLGQGIAPPPEFSRPEVAQILMDYYQALDADK